MKKLLAIVVLGLLLSNCGPVRHSWKEINYIVDHRDTRKNILNERNDPIYMIYVGVSDDKSEAFTKKVYETSIFHKGAQHVAPKEVIARQQCVKNFSLEKPVFKKMIEVSKEQRKEYKLFIETTKDLE